jgi:hypothetical protein
MKDAIGGSMSKMRVVQVTRPKGALELVEREIPEPGVGSVSQDTLAFSVLTGVRAMTEVFPLERAAEAYEHMMSGKARFRAVLTTGR